MTATATKDEDTKVPDAPEDTKGEDNEDEDEEETPEPAFDLGSGTLGNKSDNITTVPPRYVAVIEQAWEQAKIHPNKFFHVNCGNEAGRDEFHAYGKAAARMHTPRLDYRKLPATGRADADKMAYFTLRLWSEDPSTRPGRNPSGNGNSGS